MDISFRQSLLGQCVAIAERKIAVIDQAIKDGEDSLFNETKSSAGDKYETSREMIQQDLSRLEQQKSLAVNEQHILSRIADAEGGLSENIRIGSLVKTDQVTYFIAVALGKIVVEGLDIFVISAQSPIGKLLIGLEENDLFEFNGKAQRIVEVF